MTDFATLGLAEPLLRAVAAEGYTTPTPIQAQAIPALLQGRDLLGIAQTGTGKTAAFVLPTLHRLMGRPERAPRGTCRALFLAPTRELAYQINECVRAYGRFARLSSAVVVGGVRPGPQVKALSTGVDILVATPGRLLDHVGTGILRLDFTEVVVLDEADHMLDLGFLPAIRRIMARLHGERQTVLLSATMPAPIRALANDFLRDPCEVQIAPQSRPIERIEQSVMMVEGHAKRDVLVDLLRQNAEGRSIIFTRTKRGADRVTDHLRASGLPAESIHGNKSQVQRDRALAAFKGTMVRILVATDIAARGIDVDGISFVYNYELPNVPEAYVHRIGRTARAGASGVAISLCDPSERPLLRDIERLIGKSLSGEADPPPPARQRRSGPARPQRPRVVTDDGTEGHRGPRDARTEGHREPRMPREPRAEGNRDPRMPREPHAEGHREPRMPREPRAEGQRDARGPRTRPEGQRDARGPRTRPEGQRDARGPRSAGESREGSQGRKRRSFSAA
nr:DEAD/DEAH box helicase [Pararhodospirillum photometricum]